MKNWLFPVITIAALIGLGYIQFRFLRIGLLLEQRKFNQHIEASLQNTVRELNKNKHWRRLLEDTMAPADQSAKETLIDSINLFLHGELTQKQIGVDFSFAIQPSSREHPLLQSQHYDEEYFSYERFSIPFYGEVARRCRCEVNFHLHINDLFGFLLQRLYRLIVPTVTFLVAILAGIAWLLIKTRRLRELDKIKNDFINNLTHELKTPAFSISLISRMLRQFTEQNNREKALAYIDLLENENQQIKTHVEKVLELASLESGKYHLDKNLVDIHDLLAKLEKNCRIQMEQQKGTWQMSLKARNTNVRADAVHLKNAFANLVDNALKYNTNEPVINIRTFNRDKQLFVSFQDNGVGIESKDQKRVFKKFFRVSSGNLHKTKGFGLGLSYVQAIIHSHNGTITIESEPGRGATFTVAFPLAVLSR